MKNNHKLRSFSTCIISKIKVALDLPNKYRGNSKKCSKEYWSKGCKTVGKIYNCSEKTIKKAIGKFGTI